MGEGSIALFADTNAFIQLRDLKDLPWTDLFTRAQSIDVLVAPIVISELDELKDSGNSRRRDRARNALKLIDVASQNDGFSVLLRKEPVEVNLTVWNGPPIDWSKIPRLDPSRADDQLVAEAAMHGKAFIFSHDTGPRIRARMGGIKAVAPLDSWFLPPEKSEDRRRITRLEAELESLKKLTPHISLEVVNNDPKTGETLLYLPSLPSLSEDVIEKCTRMYLAEHPKETYEPQQNRILLQLHQGFSSPEIERYYKYYKNFEDKVYNYFCDLNDNISIFQFVSMSYIIKNESGVSAIGLRIDTRINGDIKYFDPKIHFDHLKMPQEPDKLRSYLEGLPSLLSNITPHLNGPRDPTAFYWFERPNPKNRSSALQCEDFRARETSARRVNLNFDGSLPLRAEIDLHVSATNLPQPLDLKIPIVIASRDADWFDDDVIARLPEEAAAIFATALDINR